MESMGHYGDSGSGALYEKDGTKYLLGVKTGGNNPVWGSQHAYTWTSGPALAWIRANMERKAGDPYISANKFNCRNWSRFGVNRKSIM